MSRYLVTGAAGFIASKVCELLLDDGSEVIGLDDLNDAYDVRLKHWRLERLQARSGFSFHETDIRDCEALGHRFDGTRPDAVLNLAARAGVRQSVENPRIYYETNVLGTLNLLDLCRDAGVEKFVLASTSSLYGAHNPSPFREDTSTSRPLSPYAASKKSAETLCFTYHYLYGLDVTILRYFTVYGPAGRPDMSLFRFVQWISEERSATVYGDGKQSRDFTYVDDIARGTVAALKPVGYEVINLGSDEPVVLMDAVRLIERLTSKKAHLIFEARHPADVEATWANITKAKEVLAWRPQTKFQDGVRNVIEWYRANRSWAKDLATG